MKRWFFGMAFLLAVTSESYAAGLYDIDWESKVWRSSVPATATSSMMVTTGTIAVYGVMVSSPITDSYVKVYNSSSTDTGVDTSSFFYMSPATDNPNIIPIKKVFNKGIRWDTSGTAQFELLWDWVGKPPLTSYDSKGRY